MMINCALSVLMISDATGTPGMPGMPGMSDMAGMPGMIGMGGRSRVRLSPTTDLTDSGGHPLECQGIHAGDHVEVNGIINSSDPGVVDAQMMKISTTS